MNAIMISIQPKWCELIVNGQKTFEVRKTRPKIDTPFKDYIYCSYGNDRENYMLGKRGKVIGEFICDRIYEIRNLGSSFMIGNDIALTNRIARESCLDYDDMIGYLGNKDGYGLHVSDLKIYDKPKELGEFYKPLKYDEDGVICGTKQEMSNIYEWDCHTLFNVPDNCDCTLLDCPKLREFYKITRPPESWFYIEEL